MVFETFDCDDEVGDGETYLRADYTLSCDTNVHRVFQGYAILMILVRLKEIACFWGGAIVKSVISGFLFRSFFLVFPGFFFQLVFYI